MNMTNTRLPCADVCLNAPVRRVPPTCAGPGAGPGAGKVQVVRPRTKAKIRPCRHETTTQHPYPRLDSACNRTQIVNEIRTRKRADCPSPVVNIPVKLSCVRSNVTFRAASLVGTWLPWE
jgi:hypothetical protein